MNSTLKSDLGALLLALLSFAANAQTPSAGTAQTFPTRPTRIIVGFAPGGTNDVLARIVAQAMRQSYGQPIIVENRPGAAGIIAAELVAKSVPDGHTLLLGGIGTEVFIPLLRANMPYDPAKDLLPVTLIGVAGTVLAVNARLPAQSVHELVALAKANPGKLTFASGGAGTTLHVAAELFKLTADVDLRHVPYRGNAPALADVVSGQVDLIFSGVPPVLPLARAGKLRLLAVSTAGRLRGLEGIPTIAESGVPGYEMTTWFGILAPGATPHETAARIAAEVKKALNVPQVREQVLVQGVEPAANTPADFRKFANEERAKWAKVFKAANIRPD